MKADLIAAGLAGVGQRIDCHTPAAAVSVPIPKGTVVRIGGRHAGACSSAGGKMAFSGGFSVHLNVK